MIKWPIEAIAGNKKFSRGVRVTGRRAAQGRSLGGARMEPDGRRVYFTKRDTGELLVLRIREEAWAHGQLPLCPYLKKPTTVGDGMISSSMVGQERWAG